MKIITELLTMFSVFTYTVLVAVCFHQLYHYLKMVKKNNKNDFLYKMLFLNYTYSEKENKIYKNQYSENLIYDPLMIIIVWFCVISYLFFPFKYIHCLVYGILTLFINYYTHAEFNMKRTYLKKIKCFVFIKKFHDDIHYKYEDETRYMRYKHLRTILVK